MSKEIISEAKQKADEEKHSGRVTATRELLNRLETSEEESRFLRVCIEDVKSGNYGYIDARISIVNQGIAGSKVAG